MKCFLLQTAANKSRDIAKGGIVDARPNTQNTIHCGLALVDFGLAVSFRIFFGLALCQHI